MSSLLFTPVRIHDLELKNRIIMPPLASGFAAQDGEVTDRLIRYYAERARGGCALVTVESTFVEPEGHYATRGTGIDCDARIRGFTKLADAIHAGGCRASLQLMHPGGRKTGTTRPLRLRRLVSFVPGVTSYSESRVMDKEDMADIVGYFAAAAVRTREAGFDAVEILAAHGYLLSQFMSPFWNKRTDEYGGCLENRMRFPLEVLRAVRLAVGDDFPISVRFCSDEYVPGGVTLEESVLMGRMFAEHGADMLNVSAGIGQSNQYTGPTAALPRGWNAESAAAVKKAIGGSVPVAIAGRINDRESAESILARGDADIICMGRALIADPDLPVKLFSGADLDVRPCISCNEGCSGGGPLGFTCAVNPRTGVEGLYPMNKADVRRRVLVVGGGVAGMQAALTAARRGHAVILMEQSNVLGGLIRTAALPPHKDGFLSLLSYYPHALEKAGVEIRLHCEATADTIEREKADVVVLATGSRPLVPRFLAQAPVVTAENILHGADCGRSVLILGGGLVGSETAEFLAMQGKEVSILELREDLALDMEYRSRAFLMPHLEKLGVRKFLQTELVEVAENKAVKIRDRFKEEQWLESYDTLVLAMGYRSYDPLSLELHRRNIHAHMIGDCRKVGKALAAIHDGFFTGYGI